jgi:hypothetical protein
VAKSYYSVLEEYCRREVWVRWDLRFVRIFNQRFGQIAMHCRKSPAQFSTTEGHIPRRKYQPPKEAPNGS